MARLIGLELTDDQLDQLEPEMESLAKNVERLREIDFWDTEPVFQFRPAVDDGRTG
jgi:Asp-tRNA(Asn)/Glu-tRNA(Gln) amidotransferase C subunit